MVTTIKLGKKFNENNTGQISTLRLWRTGMTSFALVVYVIISCWMSSIIEAKVDSDCKEIPFLIWLLTIEYTSRDDKKRKFYNKGGGSQLLSQKTTIIPELLNI